MLCSLCNEQIDDIDLAYGDVTEIEGEYWHDECFAEYFELTLEEVA